METKKLIKEHNLTKDEEFNKAYSANEPTVLEKLQWQPGECIISELDPKDQAQLLSRYLNDLCVYDKNNLHLLLRISKLLEFIARKIGVNVEAEFKDDARKLAELQEKQLEESKKALQNCKK